ncbi:MAG TPA: Rieske (2Fe-2S) protein [Pyrinomonadaceae bacterium]|nr:Rieske (2Fe-2S) protein [Pyrinomonadaceae bacterium]
MKNIAWDKGEHSAGPPGPEAPSRRHFLDYLLGTSVVATLGAILYPIFEFMSPPQVIESTESSVVAAKLSEVPANSGKIFKFGSKPGIIVRTESGELKACSAVCTHLECIVQYRPDIKHIWCACHNGHYSVDGKNISGPPPRPLEEYKVNTRGDDIVVSKS